MAKMGRPKEENPKVNRITVRFTDEENRVVLEYAKKHNMTKAEVIKAGLNLLFNN